GIGYNKIINDGERISLSNHMRDVYGNQADTLINSEYNAVLYDTIGLNIINAYLDTIYDSSGKTINVSFSEPIDLNTLIPSNFNSSKGIPDSVYLQNSVDTDKCYITFNTVVLAGSDWIALTNNIKDTSIFNNQSTILTNFIITDIDSPYIVSVTTLNNDTALGNTQLSDGDTIIIKFSEPMKFSELSKSSFIDSFPINGGISGDTYGDFNYTVSSDNKTLYISLGSGSSIFNGDTINPSPFVKDLSGNPDISSETNYILDNAGPIIISVAHLNYDTSLNSNLSVGDKILLSFSEPVLTSSFSSPNSSFLVNNISGNQFGSSINWSYTFNGNTVSIELTSGFTLKYNDIISLYTGIRDIHNNYADSFYNYVLTDSIPPYLLLSYFENCDTQYTSFSTGDTILLKFSEPIDTSSYNISNITFSDPSNSFGTGAASITLDSSFIKIILGTNSVLHNNDTVNISGIKDFNNNFNIKPFEINLYDTVPSMIINVTFTDADNNSEFSYGDTFTVFFSEPMDMSTLGNSVYSNFTDTALVLSGARNFGSNVSTLWIDNRNLNISLGNGFTVRHNDQFVLLASVIKDLNSVELSVASSGILKDTAGPQCLISYLDTVEDSYCKIIKSVFNVPIDTSTVTNLSYYTITGNTVFSATAVDSRTIKINAVNPINVSNQVITFSQNILDQNGSGNVTVSAQNIIDTSSPKILYSIINPVSSGDTLNKTIDIFFNESVNFTKASDIGNYSNLNISNITALDSNAVRITMNNQFKSINDSFYVSNITDLADSNIMANTYCIPVDLINPFLNSITVINNDSNTGFTYGDTIILYFSESINTSALTAANINTIFNSDFGDSSNSVLEWDYYNTVLKIQLGSSPSIIYPYYINPSNLITDYSGNTDSSSNKLIPDSYEPDAPYSVIMADSDVPAAFPGFDNDSSIYIYWNQPIANDIDSYAVYLSINSAPDSLVGYTANRYFSYTNLIYHNRYSAKIKSIDKSGKMSGFSAQSSIIISDSYCPVPGIPTHSDTVFNLNYDTDLTINWQWISYDTDILYYRIYIDSGAGFILYDSTANTNYRLTGTYRNNYSLKIDAVDWAGNTSSISGASIYVTIDTGNVTNPSVPVHSDNATSGYDNDTSLSFTWTPNPDADFGFYKIFYNYNSGQYIYSCTSAINSYNLIVNAAGAYSIKIYCIDSAGNQSSDSSVSSIIMVDTGVSPVNLISPANLYTNILNETFVWAASVDANTYIFQLSSDTFSTLKYSSEIQAATSSISLNLDSGVFQWRIISKDNAGNTAVSNPNQMCLCIDTFVRPPSLIYPSNNYDTINHQPSFQWTITDADTYIWYFGTDTGSGFNIIDSGIYNNTKNSDTVFSRVLSDTYFWYVYVIDNAGNTNVSMTYKIVLRGVDYFNSIYPSAGTETNNIIPRFEWESSISAVNYYIVYSLTSNFAQKYFSQTTDDTYLIPDTPIINNSYQGDTIFWYVVGTDSTGDTNFSGIKYFLIDTIADTAILISPSNLKESKDTFISFVWSKPVDSVLYKFQIDTDTNFDNDTKSINFISSIQQHDSVLEGQRTYYWRIKSSDRFRNFSYSDYN
ncbi:hypothetical protein KA977_11605, partial [Candidatus Dependentiae bacterium]|nr:hypothetical protein [Candidatus Dependentiae bacterium]